MSGSAGEAEETASRPEGEFSLAGTTKEGAEGRVTTRADLPSLTDVARAAGVSLTTASMVLNKGKQQNRVSAACAQRVQDVARKLGYVPNYHARSMKLGRAEMLAVAMDLGYEDADSPLHLELSNLYFGNLLGGIEMRLRSLGYLMTLVGPEPTVRAPDRAMLGVKQRRFDGIIVLGSVILPTFARFLEVPEDYPVVVVQPPSDTAYPTVVFDERAGIDLAVEHLAVLGHRSLLYVGETSHQSHNDIRERGFVASCEATGLQHDTISSTRLEKRDVHHPDRQITQVAKDMGTYLDAGQLKATGIVCYNDMTAIGVMEALGRRGIKVPEQVSVVGYDDTVGHYASPRLTTVSHELAEMGRVATDLCMEMVNDPAAVGRRRGSRTVVKPKLVERDSSARRTGN